ncbi:MAG: hypothetical protein OXT67_02275, partial [Zetaproteobacteria bacterium]|nr:hypothetical protein [Zetaproteobacteria bacterium]
VEMYPIQGAVVMRYKSSELLIMPEHVDHLFKCESREDFQQYFLRTALVNRSARKVFEAWSRKDRGIWNRLAEAVTSSYSDAHLEGEDAEDVSEPTAAAETTEPNS